jgi:hypothetical protein
LDGRCNLRGIAMLERGGILVALSSSEAVPL